MAQARGFPVVELVDDMEYFRRTQTRRSTYRLQEAGLRGLLLRDDVRGLPVAVVSVAGAYRGGKSFLLNYFIRYLSATASSRADGSWIGVPGQRLQGFDWAPGTERSTTGVLLWPEPFFIQKDGGRVAVLLMDTQGTFDNQSSFRDNSTIFALSTLVSSLQIYNIKTQIDDCHLMNLEAFTQYGVFMKEHIGEAFQELKFLVRDWEHAWQYPYGDGDAYKRHKLQVVESQSDQSNRIRERISSCFEAITCFLMPHPGREVPTPGFQSNPGELDTDFKRELKSLASCIFSPEKLRVKTLGGQPVTAQALYGLIRTYVDSFNSDELPEPRTIYENQSEAALLMAANAACELFDGSARREAALSMPDAVLVALHGELLNAALAPFENRRLFCDQSDIDSKKEELRTEFTDRLNDMRLRNTANTQIAVDTAIAAYDAAIGRLRRNQILCVHARDLEQTHDDGLAAAVAAFDGNRKRLNAGQTDPEKLRLLMDCQSKYDSHTRENEFNNSAVASEMKSDYTSYMMAVCNLSPRLSDVAFEEKHEQQLARALERFERQCRPNQHPEDPFKDQLKEDIDNQYEILEEINRCMNADLLNLSWLVYLQGSVPLSALRRHCMHPKVLAEVNQQAFIRAFDILRPGQPIDPTALPFTYVDDNVDEEEEEGDEDDDDNDDDDEKILTRAIQKHYRSLVASNIYSNIDAVEKAHKAYQVKFKELTDYFGYFMSTRKTTNSYQEEAWKEAEDMFYGYRRDKDYRGYDRYLDQLKRVDYVSRDRFVAGVNLAISAIEKHFVLAYSTELTFDSNDREIHACCKPVVRHVILPDKSIG